MAAAGADRALPLREASPIRAGDHASTREGAQATLYVIPGSHACRAGMLLLEHKSIPYRTVKIPTGLHPVAVRLLGFPGNREPIRSLDGQAHAPLATLDRLGTVPALRYGEQRVQTNREIAAFLERLQPDPPLYPSDPELRAQVQEAVVFADDTLQMAARRAVLAGAAGGLGHLHRRGGDGRLGALLAHRTPVRVVANGVAARLTFRAGPDRDAELVAALPPLLDRVDGWIADGVLGAPDLNAADLMIAPSLALLDYRLDLRAGLRERPLYALLERVLPEPA
jgi:glutathione S-transferase